MNLQDLASELPIPFVDVSPGEFSSVWSTNPVKQEVRYAFLISSTIVTVGQWRRIAELPFWLAKKEDQYPAEGINFPTALEFVSKLGRSLNLPANLELSLPWEAEWELACRAGTSTKWWFGDSPDQLGEYAWFGDNSQGQVHNVGELRANPLGLFDMYGNVSEWCLYDVSYRSDASAQKSSSADHQVLIARGGCCYSSALECSSDAREYMPWENPMNDPVGIRLVIREARTRV